jgi:hypothetical protein
MKAHQFGALRYGLDICVYCARRKGDPVHVVRQRACSICEDYAVVGAMATKPDGRVICAHCQTKLDRSAAEKAQPDLFVEQKGLFQ